MLEKRLKTLKLEEHEVKCTYIQNKAQMSIMKESEAYSRCYSCAHQQVILLIPSLSVISFLKIERFSSS